MMIRIACLITLLMPFAGQARIIEEIVGLSGEMIRYGIYTRADETRLSRDAPETASGYISALVSRHVSQQDTLQLQLGIGFGFDYRIVNAGFHSDREMIPVEIVTEHPPIRGDDGNTSTLSKVMIGAQFVNGVFEDSLIYYFSEQREMVPGLWTLKVRCRGETLLEKTFHVEPETSD